MNQFHNYSISNFFTVERFVSVSDDVRIVSLFSAVGMVFQRGKIFIQHFCALESFLVILVIFLIVLFR